MGRAADHPAPGRPRGSSDAGALPVRLPWWPAGGGAGAAIAQCRVLRSVCAAPLGAGGGAAAASPGRWSRGAASGRSSAVLGPAWAAFWGLGLAPQGRVEVRNRKVGVVAWPGGHLPSSSWGRRRWSPYPSPRAGASVRGRRCFGDDWLRCGSSRHPYSPSRSFRTHTKQSEGPSENLHEKTLLGCGVGSAGKRARPLTLDWYDSEERAPENETTRRGPPTSWFDRMDTSVDNLTAATRAQGAGDGGRRLIVARGLSSSSARSTRFCSALLSHDLLRPPRRAPRQRG